MLQAQIERKEFVDSKGVTHITISEKEKELPPEFKWVLHLLALKEKGYILKYIYSNNGKKEAYDKLKYFQLDSVGQSFIPIKPEKVMVSEYKEGRGFVEVAELGCSKDFLDPPLDIAMSIWEKVRKL